MTAIDPGDEHAADGPLARLFAGGRHVRLLMLGQPLTALTLPSLAHFERVVGVTRPDEPPVGVVADPLRLPFYEAVFDRALVSGRLPATQARAELRELWRVLAPAGLALLVVKARRRWQFQADGWPREALAALLADAMFEVLDWQVATLPDRWHLVLVGKVDGLRPALIGRVEALASVAQPA